MRSMTRYQANRHPVAAVLICLLLGPYILAAALLITAVYVTVVLACLISGNGELLRGKR